MSFSRERVQQILAAHRRGEIDDNALETAFWLESYPENLPKPDKRTVVLWVVVNEDDKVTAASTRDEALSYMADGDGGHEFDIIKLTLTLDRRKDSETSIEVKREDVSTLVVKAEDAELAED